MLDLMDKEIKLPDIRVIPTELFLDYIGKDMKYYEQKMNQEAKVKKLKGENYEPN